MRAKGNIKYRTAVLRELKPLREFQQEVSNIFPSRGSLDWHVRIHKSEYVEAGGIIEIAGRMMVHPRTFKKTTLAIASRETSARHKSGS